MCRDRDFCCDISKSRCNTSGRIYGRCWGLGPTDIWLNQQHTEAGLTAGKGFTALLLGGFWHTPKIALFL